MLPYSGSNSEWLPKRYVHVLTHRTWECDLIWKRGLFRCNQGEGRWDEIKLGHLGEPLIQWQVSSWKAEGKTETQRRSQQKLEGCGHKPRGASSHENLEEAGRVLLSLWWERGLDGTWFPTSGPRAVREPWPTVSRLTSRIPFCCTPATSSVTWSRNTFLGSLLPWLNERYLEGIGTQGLLRNNGAPLLQGLRCLLPFVSKNSATKWGSSVCDCLVSRRSYQGLAWKAQAPTSAMTPWGPGAFDRAPWGFVSRESSVSSCGPRDDKLDCKFGMTHLEQRVTSQSSPARKVWF